MPGNLTYMAPLECVDLVERITDYLEGSLDAEMHEQLVKHLGKCWSCEHYLGEMTVTVRLISELPPEPLPPELESSLLDAFRAEFAAVPALD